MTQFGRRLALFGIICVVAAAGLAWYINRAANRPLPAGLGDEPEIVASSSDAATLAAIRAQPHLLFVNTTFDDRNSRIGMASLADPGGPRYIGALSCERVYVAGTRGLCLSADRGVLTRYYGHVLDESFNVLTRFPLKGTPSRARLSRDGRFGAVTVFVSGDSYAANGFSTRTTLIETDGARSLGDLEEFTVIRDGRSVRKADFNFWGVTFGPESGVFYATLSTGGEMLLVTGNTSSRELTVVHEGVECPSLSPDGTRIAYKKRSTEGGRLAWRLRVVNLQTKADIAVAETRSVDDQAEWLDNEHLLYGLPRDTPVAGGADIWTVPADGTGSPRLTVRQAYSPAVARPITSP
jgi:hypothetical protein